MITITYSQIIWFAIGAAIGSAAFTLIRWASYRAYLRFKRPAVCQCQSLGHPEQCDEGPGCRWMRRLAKHNPDPKA